jgi:hypothetical protein
MDGFYRSLDVVKNSSEIQTHSTSQPRMNWTTVVGVGAVSVLEPRMAGRGAVR